MNSAESNLSRPGRGLPVWLLIGAGLSFSAVAFVYAFSIAFSKFAFYDDQGYVMLSVQGFLSQHPLYDRVFTIYGPCYYLYKWCVHSVTSLPVNHDITGALCVVHWWIAAVILSLAAFRLTRSPLLSLFVFVQTIVHLTGLANEPGHPQELVVMLLGLAALLAAGGEKKRWTMIFLGGIGASLFLTKINIGLFYGMGLLIVLLCQGSFRYRRIPFVCFIAVSAGLPFLLMRSHLHVPLIQDYAWRSCASLLAVALTAFAFAAGRRHGVLPFVWAGGGFALSVVLILSILVLRGSSLSSMVECMVAIPSTMTGLHALPMRVSNTVLPSAAALLFALAALLLRTWLERVPRMVAAAKGLYGFLGTVLFVADVKTQLAFLLPWLWIALIPNPRVEQREVGSGFSRGFLCLVAAWQGLQAYPVAGTQMMLATFLPVLVFSLCAYDSIEVFWGSLASRRGLATQSSRAGLLLKCLGLAALLYLFVGKWATPLWHWRYYASATPLNLPGASFVRLAGWQTESYQALTAYLRAECDTFFTVPGFNSLHFWTGKPPPTYLNVFEAVCLSEWQQNEVVRAIQHSERALIVVNERRLPLHTDAFVFGEGVLGEFARDQCQEIARVGGCRILKPKPLH